MGEAMGLPGWDEVETVLAGLEAPLGPAGCHGLLCGVLCAPAAEPATLWLREALDRAPEQAPPAPLDALFRETSRQLDDDAFRFELLLPPDDRPLAGRTAALASWCGGFGYGIGASGLSEAAMSAEAAEFLADVVAIGQVEAAEGDTDEAGEAAWTEIVEYLRVGVLMMRNG